MLTKFSDLENKSVLITGGGSGIGAEITKAFIQQGLKFLLSNGQMQSIFVIKLKLNFIRVRTSLSAM